MQSQEKRNLLIVFDDVIADMINNKILHPVVTELFIQSCFKVPKYLRLNSTHL